MNPPIDVVPLVNKIVAVLKEDQDVKYWANLENYLEKHNL